MGPGAHPHAAAPAPCHHAERGRWERRRTAPASSCREGERAPRGRGLGRERPPSPPECPVRETDGRSSNTRRARSPRAEPTPEPAWLSLRRHGNNGKREGRSLTRAQEAREWGGRGWKGAGRRGHGTCAAGLSPAPPGCSPMAPPRVSCPLHATVCKLSPPRIEQHRHRRWKEGLRGTLARPGKGAELHGHPTCKRERVWSRARSHTALVLGVHDVARPEQPRRRLRLEGVAPWKSRRPLGLQGGPHPPPGGSQASPWPPRGRTRLCLHSEGWAARRSASPRRVRKPDPSVPSRETGQLKGHR